MKHQQHNRKFLPEVWEIMPMLLLLICLSSCQSSPSLIVYCDPWAELQVHDQLVSFQETHPEIQWEMKILSSEMIAQHIKFGQPIDVFIACGDYFSPESPQGDFGITGLRGSEAPLGNDRVVEVQVLPSPNQSRFNSQHCQMIAASDRPLRVYTEMWNPTASNSIKCRIVANFFRQTCGYLLQGWVGSGYVFESFALQHPDKLEIKEKGPEINHVYRAVMLNNCPHPESAQLLMDHFIREK